MLPSRSVKQLYPLALAEGEGVGTAYEYFTKRLSLRRWLATFPTRPQQILIAGLPQKYGCSLDFFLLAEELGARLTVVDERPTALAKAAGAWRAAQQMGYLLDLEPIFQPTAVLATLPELNDRSFDLALSSEVVQRLDAPDRTPYVTRLQALATAVAIFTPNGENEAHVHQSGLGGVSRLELQELWGNTAVTATYIDLPPFPPGITRTDEQRTQATSGRFEAFAMWGLGGYAHLEKWLPLTIRRQHAHIVYTAHRQTK